MRSESCIVDGAIPSILVGESRFGWIAATMHPPGESYSGRSMVLTLNEDAHMIEQKRNDVDAIKELRLRRWARENYVAISERGSEWHPIVLEEMQLRDRELNSELPVDVSRSSYVPLVPEMPRIVHPAHRQLPAPNLLRETVRRESDVPV